MHRIVVICLLLGLCRVALAGAPTTRPTRGPVEQTLVLHLPGIGGHRLPDELLTRGLRAGGLDAEMYIYDWTGDDEGLNALTDGQRHAQQAEIVARKIASVAAEQPGRQIVLTCHSAGAGIAAWALERLPDGVKVDDWLLVAPALSPEFDLSPALRRVRGAAYVFSSEHDPILGFGTRNFGTVDRVKSDAGGRVGFRIPADAADPAQYGKLQQFPYRLAWLKAGHAGDHIGAMMHPFARKVIAPLLLTGTLPDLSAPATRPAEPADAASTPGP